MNQKYKKINQNQQKMGQKDLNWTQNWYITIIEILTCSLVENRASFVTFRAFPSALVPIEAVEEIRDISSDSLFLFSLILLPSSLQASNAEMK